MYAIANPYLVIKKKFKKNVPKKALPNDEHAESGVGGGKSSLT